MLIAIELILCELLQYPTNFRKHLVNAARSCRIQSLFPLMSAPSSQLLNPLFDS